MPSIIEPSPHNAQRKPPEWDGLIDIANGSIKPDLPISEQLPALLDVWCEAGSMDAEQVEVNRYYGLGLVTCTFARACAGEEGRQRLVETAVQELIGLRRFNYALDRNITVQGLRTDGLYLGELSASPSFVPYSFGRDTYNSLPLEERVVSNALESLPKPQISAHEDQRFQPLVLDDEPAYRTVSDNAFAGATSVLRLALQRIHKTKTGLWISKEDIFTTPVKAIADEETIAGLELTHAGATMADLRVDEMLLMGEILNSDAAGQLYPDRTAIPKTPTLLSPEMQSIVVHTQRLGCPALYIAGLIPLITTVLPEIVNEAQRRLQAPGRAPRIII